MKELVSVFKYRKGMTTLLYIDIEGNAYGLSYNHKESLTLSEQNYINECLINNIADHRISYVGDMEVSLLNGYIDHVFKKNIIETRNIPISLVYNSPMSVVTLWDLSKNQIERLNAHSLAGETSNYAPCQARVTGYNNGLSTVDLMSSDQKVTFLMDTNNLDHILTNK